MQCFSVPFLVFLALRNSAFYLNPAFLNFHFSICRVLWQPAGLKKLQPCGIDTCVRWWLVDFKNQLRLMWDLRNASAHRDCEMLVLTVTASCFDYALCSSDLILNLHQKGEFSGCSYSHVPVEKNAKTKRKLTSANHQHVLALIFTHHSPVLLAKP